MKKLLGLFLVLAMSWPVSAAIVDNVEAIGRIDVVAAGGNHNLKAKGAASRVLAGLSADLTEDVKANVLFDYTNNWDGATAGNAISSDDASASGYLQQVHLVNANVVLSNLFDRFELTLGRQFYGDDDSTVLYFGPKSGYLTAFNGEMISLEAAKLTYSDDVKSVTLLAGKLFSSMRNIPGDLFGVDARFNVTNNVKAQVYGYAFRDIGMLGIAADPQKYEGFYGAKLSYAPEAFTASVEAARGFAGKRLIEEAHDNPWLVKVDASLNMDAFTPRAAFFYQKGTLTDFGAYAPGLVIGQYWATMGNSSYILDNARIFNVGVDYNLDKWTFALDGFAFQDRTAQDSATWEADLTANYQHNENVNLFAGIGYAKIGGNQRLSRTVAGPDAVVYQIGTTINF